MTSTEQNEKSVSIFSLPIDVQETVIHHLMEENKSLVNLRLTCRRGLNLIDHDDLLWKEKITSGYLIESIDQHQDELNFPTLSTARNSGYQTLYKGLSHPDLYVWGQYGQGRLGVHPSEMSLKMKSLVMRHQAGIPFPWKLELEKKYEQENTSRDRGRDKRDWGVPVKLVAGGWSFHALTSKGKVIFWGTMNGEGFMSRPNIRNPYQTIHNPRLLDLPNLKIKQLSCGRSHASTLALEVDQKAVEKFGSGYKILEWNSWGIIGFLRLQGVHLIGSSSYQSQAPEGGSNSSTNEREEVIMLEAGWDFTVLLTKRKKSLNGDKQHSTSIYFWRNDWVKEQESGEDHKITPGGDETLSLVKFINPVKLPDLPTVSRDPFYPAFERCNSSNSDPGNRLQAVNETHEGCLSADEIAAHAEIVKVAAGMGFIIALTRTGLVYKLDLQLPRDRMYRYLTEDEEDQIGERLRREQRTGLPGQGTANNNNAPPEPRSSRERRELEAAFEKGSASSSKIGDDGGGSKWELLTKFCLPQEMEKEFERANRTIDKHRRGDQSQAQAEDQHQGSEERHRAENEAFLKSSSLSSLVTSATRITHISAHFSNFAVYSVPPAAHPSFSNSTPDAHNQSNIVLISHQGAEVRWSTSPKIIPSLQGRGVIDISFGDWHYGALTQNGEILTWGQWSNGALGIWDALEPDSSMNVEREDTDSNDDQDQGHDDDANGNDDSWTGMFRRTIGNGLPFLGNARQTRDMSRLGRPGSVVAQARERREMEQRSTQARDQARAQSRGQGPPSTRASASRASTQTPFRQLSEEEIETLRCQVRRHPNKIEEPTEISLQYMGEGVGGGNNGKKKFAFDLAMAGWHSGALAVDLPEHHMA